MHRSQLAGFIIDCRTDDLDAAARFWGEALGLTRVAPEVKPGDTYVPFARDPNGINIEVQEVDHDSRVHLDIESDDIEAEAARLEKLGARALRKIHTWWVMEAPTGQRFCIVHARRAKFQAEATVWP